MKKIKEFCKNNWLFILFVIPLIFISMENKYPDNDIWFLLNGGRYVLNHGIPYIDPFTIHENLSFVMQQWSVAVIFYLIYKYLGYKAILGMVYIMSLIFMFVFYKICYLVSEKKEMSIIATVIAFSLGGSILITRPQLFSYLFLLIEILLLELYIKKKNKKYLIGLPIISLFFINMHASMWFLQFAILLPFIINAIRIKNIKLLERLYIDKYELKPLIYAAIAMLLVGFINPYGLDAITYLFKSYGVQSINAEIGEMHPLAWSSMTGKYVFFIVIFIFFLMYVRKDIKMDVRYFFLICGTLLLAVMHQKTAEFFIIISIYCIMAFMKKIDLRVDIKLLKNKVVIALKNGLRIGLILSLVSTLGILMYYSFSYYDFDHLFSYEDSVDYIVNNYDKEDVILYVDFNNGGYTEWRGLKSYIDGRAELFLKQFNGKADIFKESNELESVAEYDFSKFVKKYNFTHIILYSYTSFSKYLDTSKDYVAAYKDRVSDLSSNEVNLIVYIRKDVYKSVDGE